MDNISTITNKHRQFAKELEAIVNEENLNIQKGELLNKIAKINSSDSLYILLEVANILLKPEVQQAEKNYKGETNVRCYYLVKTMKHAASVQDVNSLLHIASMAEAFHEVDTEQQQ